jgi:hyaluronan synthase
MDHRLTTETTVKKLELAREGTYENLLKFSIFMFITMIILLAILTGSFKKADYWYHIHYVPRYFTFPLFFYACMVFIHLPYRALLSFRYHPFPAKSKHLPRVTVVIPAYNEGVMVEKSIISAVLADYPKELMEVICIDDASKDDTWYYIDRARRRYPELVKTIRFKKNKGKRGALAAGMRIARGDIIVTMDSDSVMERDALREIVAPFDDPTVGASTAKVKVYNKSENLLTRMLGVRYTLAFEFFRASRSTFRTVFCCSGVLSAYRKKLIDKILEPWENQRFLNQRCTYGDDRSLTNFVLRSGYDTIYQKTAVVYTTVPNNLKKLANMLTRWHKSFIRESIIFATFMFKRYRPRNRFLPVFDFALSVTLVPFQFYIFFYSVRYFFIDPILILRFLAMISIMGSIYILLYIKFEKNSDFIFGLLYPYLHVFVLMWTIPYAAITFRDNSWLTR